MTAAVPDPDWLYSEASGALYGPSDSPHLRVIVATEVDPKFGHLIADVMNRAAEVEARVQAAANQRAVLRPFEELFSGDPDTSCRTTWRREPGWSLPGSMAVLTECVEVPMDDLRDAFDRAAALASPAPAPRAEPTGELREQIPYMLENTREEFERVRELAWPAPALDAEAGR